MNFYICDDHKKYCSNFTFQRQILWQHPGYLQPMRLHHQLRRQLLLELLQMLVLISQLTQKRIVEDGAG